LGVPQASLERPGELESQALFALHLHSSGLLPSVCVTPSSPGSISPIWRQTLPVTGAPALPRPGEHVGSSTPLDARTLVVLVLVRSQDGRRGVAMVSGVRPGDRMEQWHLLVDPSTQQQITSEAGQVSSVLVRFEYTHMQIDREHPPMYDAHSPLTGGQKGFSHLPPLTYDSVQARPIAKVALLPTMIRPAQSSQSIPANYRTQAFQALDKYEGEGTLRIVPDVPARPILIRSCRSTGDEPLVFEIAGLAESISISECSRVRVVSVQVLDYVHVATSNEIELVLGGEPPRMHLAGVEGCTIKVHKSTWKNEIECIACKAVSVNAVEEGEADTLNLQEAFAVERVLLPDSLQTLVQAGRMTTQCHFSHFDLNAAQPAMAADRKSPVAQRSAPPTAVPDADTYTQPPGTSTGQTGEGERFGVGLLLKKTEDGSLQVARVAEGGAAYKDARIQAGDLLIAINGIPSHGKRLRDVGEELSGPLGSEVWLSLQQDMPMRHGLPRPEKHLVLYRGPISLNGQPNSNSSSHFGPQPSGSSALTRPSTEGSMEAPGMHPSSADLDARLNGTRRRIEQALTNVGVDVIDPLAPQSHVGVGLAVRQASDRAYRVSGLVKSGAAEACGQIAIGDVLHSVDGVNIFNSSLDMVKNLVQGPPGSRVVLSFLRPEAMPQDLAKSVNDFEHWRPVVLTRTSNPRGDQTPVTGHDEEEMAAPTAQPRPPVATRSGPGARSPPGPVSSGQTRMPANDQNPTQPLRHEEPIGLTLHLEENFNAVAGTESLRNSFCAELAADLSTCLRTAESRILVVDLLPGSVLADIHIFPAMLPNDHRSPERLAAELAVMVVDPQVTISEVSRTMHSFFAFASHTDFSLRVAS